MDYPTQACVYPFSDKRIWRSYLVSAWPYAYVHLRNSLRVIGDFRRAGCFRAHVLRQRRSPALLGSINKSTVTVLSYMSGWMCATNAAAEARAIRHQMSLRMFAVQIVQTVPDLVAGHHAYKPATEEDPDTGASLQAMVSPARWPGAIVDCCLAFAFRLDGTR